MTSYFDDTGHSFLGRCGGDGVMQISVHYMKGIKVNLNCTENALGCMNVQAGVQWIEAYNEVNTVQVSVDSHIISHIVNRNFSLVD